MLTIQNLSICSKKDLKFLVKDFNYSLNRNDKIALVGKEGNGKTTFLKAIYDLSLVSDYAEIKGDIDTRNEIISFLSQENNQDILGKSACQILDENTSDLYFDYNLYYHYLNYFNLDEDIIDNNKRFGDLSGGEKIKFKLLLCMLKNPTIWLLDEPSNDLDLKSLKILEKFIREVSMPVLFVSHDEYLLKRCANGIIHFEELPTGECRYSISNKPYEDYILEREENVVRKKQVHKKEQEDFDKKVKNYRKLHDKVQDRLRNTKSDSVGKNLKDKMRSIKSMGKRLEKEKKNMTDKPVFENEINPIFSKNLGLHNKKNIIDLSLLELKIEEKVLVENIDLHLRAKEKVCIVGDNGVGKTTLLKNIVENLKRSDINYFYMSQNYDASLEFQKSAIDFLSKDFTKEEHNRIGVYLGSLNYSREEMLRPISSLSGGQKCELLFAKMILGEYDFLVLDEPTRNLSPISSGKVRTSLREYNGGILAVSHDLEFIASVFEKIYYLSKSGLRLVEYEDLVD